MRNLLHAIDKTYHVERTGKIVSPSTSNSKASSGNSKPNNDKKAYAKKKAAKAEPSSPWVEGARPNASNIYVNPNSTTAPKRQRLKLSK